MGAGDDMAARANEIIREVRERTAPQMERLVSALMALSFGAAYQSREDVAGEIERGMGDKRERFLEAEPNPPLSDELASASRFIPDTLKKQLAGRTLTWASVTNEDLLRTIQTTIMEGMVSGAGDVESLKARLDSAFRGWIDDGTLDPSTGEKLTKASKLEAIARTQASSAYNAGRIDAIMDPEADVVVALEYSAVMDGRTSDFCQKWDGKVIAKTPENESLIRELNPPNHVHCRSMFVPILRGETWGESERPNVQPQKGFGVLPTVVA